MYRPIEGTATYRWPGQNWEQSFAAFQPGHRVVPVAEESATSRSLPAELGVRDVD